MTTKSSMRNIKSKLASSPSVRNPTGNGSETKSSRICIKKPLSTTSFLPNNSATSGFSSQLKKRTLQLNHFFQSKIKSGLSNEQGDSPQLTEHSPSPPLVFHAIAPASSEDSHHHQGVKTQTSTEALEQSQNEPASPASRRIAHILNHTNIKVMTTNPDLIRAQPHWSEDDASRLSFQSVEGDADADESDDDACQRPKKSRRMQKNRKTESSPFRQKSEHKNGKDDQRHPSSSNDDEHYASNSTLNGSNDRRSKSSLSKKTDRVTSTTTDDDIVKKYHCYHPLDNLEAESTPSPTVTVSSSVSLGKKPNRFQVKSIRKSQQQHGLIANVIKAKLAIDDDCSVPDQNFNSQLKPSIIERKNTNTPSTDGENTPTPNTSSVVSHGVSTANTMENGHHRVRFQVTPHGKQESATEEEKVPSQSVAIVTLSAPAPSLSTASVQGDDDEEGEAMAKSPDGRFIRYAKEIGRGAFKTVYRGLDTEASIAVAWCELQDFAQFDKHERARFKEEAEMLKKLQHPNIVRFYDFWEETNPRTNKKVIILVTELMTSGSLKGYIRKFKGQKEEKRINVMKKWCRQILKGLAYLHGRNPPVIHRDLKCDNVFISSTTGCVKIGDLGLATFKTQPFAKSMRGTMEFMAPEMFDEQYDELVDVYSFGLCMLEMITDEYPYIECKGPTAVIKRVTAGLKPECYYKVESEDVREVIECCIRTKRAERLPVTELLQHSFFLDDNGLRIDVVRDPANDGQVMTTANSIDLKLKIIDKSKRKALWTEHEAIRFRYNFTSETPEQIVNELIEKKYIFEEDKKFVIQSINDRLRAYQYEQLDRKAGVFYRQTKAPVNHTPQTSTGGQAQQQHSTPVQQLPPTTPVVAPPQVATVPSNTPTTTITPPIDVLQPPALRPAVESSQSKPIAVTEPISIVPMAELSSSVSGSAGSLEKLDAALKITLFNKTKASQSVSTTSTVTNDTSEPPTPIVIQDDSSMIRLGSDDQRPMKEAAGPIHGDLTMSTLPSSNPTISQTQSQPTTMLTHHQKHILQNPLLLNQTPSSYSYSTITPSPHLINTTLASDALKPLVPPPPPPSSSSTTTETIENSHVSVSPSHTLEAMQFSLPSDTSLPTQPPMLDSLKHLDALLKNALKNPSKTQSSDTETATASLSLAATNETSTKSIEIDADETKAKALDQSSTPAASATFHSQPTTSSLLLPVPVQQVKSQPVSCVPTRSELFTSPDRSLHELETLLKSPQNKALSNDDTIVSSSNEVSEIKSMIADLSRTLLSRMNVIESKIDDHRNQTLQINHLLTNTVLPSLVDLADIIHQSPDLDSRTRTRLDNIRTAIRSTQQEQQTEMKDLMEI